MSGQTFAAPWSRSVRLISALVTALLIGISGLLGVLALTEPGPGTGSLAVGAAGSLVILLGSALFTIRGYRLESGELYVHRLLWSTRISLSGLRRARVDPEAMRRSWRLFGNGGLYSISGLFRSSALGTYRAFATDPGRAVVLETDDRRLVVTPARPEELVAELKRLHPGIEAES